RTECGLGSQIHSVPAYFIMQACMEPHAGFLISQEEACRLASSFYFIKQQLFKRFRKGGKKP
ncbi:hypothetical protein NE681_17275, partial [Faecalibacillus intestinalis]|nr:hypothetical protein [Faecalibacillus intestinalis]